MLILTNYLPAGAETVTSLTLPLTAEERTRSRYRVEIDKEVVHLQLPRGTILQDGDLLQTETGDRVVKIVAKPEPVMTAIAPVSLSLLKAAYHLGNRHVRLEVTVNYLRFNPDPVLKSMLEQMGLQVTEEVLPFHPEIGAYHHH